jgi:hypothetical protein
MRITKAYGLGLLVFFLCYSSSKADEVCPSGTVGLCDPTVLETIVETVDVTSQNDGQGTLTTTVTTVTTTTDTVTNEDSGDLLASGSGYVASSKEGDMDTDWGGQGSATMPSGSGCGALGTDKCASITGSGNTTSVMGVPNMGTTFKQTIDISDLKISSGGKTTYTIKVDKQDASDSIYMHITGKDGNTTSFAGTDVLSATGVSSGYAEYTGSFDFANSLTTLIVEVGGRDINLAIGPLFDDVSINVLYNVISQIVLQTITTIEQYVYTNGDATQEEIDIVKDIFEHNDTVEQPDGSYDLKPIDGGDTNEDSYESVELELELPEFDMDFEVEFDMPEMDIGPPLTTVEMNMESTVEANIEMELAPEPQEVEVVAVSDMPKPEPEEAAPEVETTAEPEPVEEATTEPEVKEETEPKPEPETKEEIKVKEEPKPEVKVVKKKVTKPKTKTQKKVEKQKAGSKIVKKMGDKGRYDSANQLKTLIVMQVLGETKEFFSAQKIIPDVQGFFTSGVVPDAKISDNNFASFMLKGKSHVTMNALIDSQYK